jgi:hypothetical protein
LTGSKSLFDILASASAGVEAMVRNRAVQVLVALLAAICVTAPVRADGLWGLDYDSDFANQSAYLRWISGTELAGRAAPIAFANKPCYVYEGSSLVVLPCPGTVVASDVDYAVPLAGAYGHHCYRSCRRNGSWVSRRY